MSMSIDYQKAICWEEFIKIAFSMYAPGVINPAQPKNFPKGWKLVKNINAEAVVSFYRQNEFIGFVAQCEKEPNRFAVVMHGTEGVTEFLDDLEFLMTDFKLVPHSGRTENGFTRIYESFTFVDPISGDSKTLVEYIDGLSQNVSFTLAGHSLGGALATLHSLVLASRNIPVEAYLFASPMVGDATFVNTYNSLVKQSYRIVNKPDIVPKLPGTLLGYTHVDTLYEINSLDYPEIKRTTNCFHSQDVYIYTLIKAANAKGDTNTNLGSCKA